MRERDCNHVESRIYVNACRSTTRHRRNVLAVTARRTDVHASRCFNRVNTVRSAEARRGGLLARSSAPSSGVCAYRPPQVLRTFPAGHVQESWADRRKDRRGDSRNASVMYEPARALGCVYATYGRPPRVRVAIWSVLRPTVMVALDNVSGFMPPMDFFLPRTCRIIQRITSLRKGRRSGYYVRFYWT